MRTMKLLPLLAWGFAGLIGLTACGESETLSEADYISRAKAYLEEGNRRSAVVELRNALAINPKNRDMNLLLAETVEELG